MLGEHPSPDLLERYFMNHVSETERAIVEQHVFACSNCFSRVSLFDVDSLAVTKACSMLGELESQGTRVLTISAPQPERSFIILPSWAPRFEFHYAAAAATFLFALTALSSVSLIKRDQGQDAVAEETLAVATVPKNAEILNASLRTALAVYDLTSPDPRIPASRPEVNEPPTVIVPIRFEKPFLPPSRRMEQPELVMTHVAPSVVAQQAEPPPTIVKLPQVPKPRMRRSRRVLQVLVSPFKKLGGTLAALR
jgi:hypothetical protein